MVLVLLSWLLTKRHLSAALHGALAILVLEAALFLWLPETTVRPGLPIAAGADGSLLPNARVMRITLLCMLGAAFVAREIGAHQRWLIFGFSMLPILVTTSAQLYQSSCRLTDVLISVVAGFALGSLIMLSFGRHQTRSIVPDGSFWLALVVAAGCWLIAAGNVG